MTLSLHPVSAELAKPASALATLSSLVLRQVGRLWRALTHRREVRQLLELTDRELQDIGLVRSDVIGALAEPMAADPSTVLLVRSVERRSRLRAVAPASRRLTAAPRG